MNGVENGSAAECSGDKPDVLLRQLSRVSIYDSDDDEPKFGEGYLGPIVSLREHLERDKDDESLRRWKEQLLGNVELQSLNERIEPEVKLICLTVITEGRPDVEIPLPFVPNARGYTFTLKEGSTYSLKFTFSVHHNIVSGLVHTNTVWKNGLKVDQTRRMLGTYAPQQEPYSHTIEEETTPSGILARGAYSARMKFVDDDKRCYLDVSYTFEIRKDWD